MKVRPPPRLPRALMSPAEMEACLKSVYVAIQDAAPAKIFVELGVRLAGTSSRVLRILMKIRRPTHLIGVDCDPKADVAWRRTIGTDMEAGDHKVTWEFLRMRTEEALKGREPGSLAWVLVDACHCFECAYGDMASWSALLAPGGILVAHDTTPRRRHYTKKFQHGGTRTFGSWEAAEKAEAEGGCLAIGFKKLWDVDDQSGIRVWQKDKA